MLPVFLNFSDYDHQDHEHGGIPIEYESPEKMDTTHNHYDVEQPTVSKSPEREEYHDCVPAPLSRADLVTESSASPALPLQSVPQKESTTKADINLEKLVTHSHDENADDDDLLVPPALLTKAELMSTDAADSPAMPLQKPAVADTSDALSRSTRQNNLELIRVSDEGTPQGE